MLRLPIDETSAKIRTGDPKDDEEDYSMNVWAGVLPLSIGKGTPIADKRLDRKIVPPEYIVDYRC